MANVITWFEIPATDFKRACKFYADILQRDIEHPHEGGPLKMGFFPGMDKDDVGGAIVCGDPYEPSAKGVVVYLNAGDDLNIPLNRVEAAGGKVLLGKTPIGENGFVAHFLDSEGNRVALHSKK